LGLCVCLFSELLGALLFLSFASWSFLAGGPSACIFWIKAQVVRPPVVLWVSASRVEPLVGRGGPSAFVVAT
jgi:hypothetical protein